MQIIDSTPIADGFRMPAEYEPHLGTFLVWPVRPGSWTNGGREAKVVFTQIARSIAESEEVYLLCKPEHESEVRRVFAEEKRIHILVIPTDDAWARDIGPTGVVNDRGEVRGVNWAFNAWGGSYDGLYEDYELDNAAAKKMCESLNLSVYDASPFVLEGGSIHSDGEGTILVTESCLLSQGRNPEMTKEEITERLCEYLGAKKVIWLPRGIDGDETNEHVDNFCAFVGPAEVVIAWTEDPEDRQWGPSHESLAVLEQETDAKGRAFTIHKLPIPKKPVCITKEELEAFVFEDGEDVREVGERLAASYVNFYLTNGAVLVPQFGDENDEPACALLGKLFPGRKVIPIPARPIIVGGGNIHCITQQIPDVLHE